MEKFIPIVYVIIPLVVGFAVGCFVTYFYMETEQKIKNQHKALVAFIDKMRKHKNMSITAQTKAIQEFAKECSGYHPDAFKDLSDSTFKRVIELLLIKNYSFVSSPDDGSFSSGIYVSDEKLLNEIEKAITKAIDAWSVLGHVFFYSPSFFDPLLNVRLTFFTAASPSCSSETFCSLTSFCNLNLSTSIASFNNPNSPKISFTFSLSSMLIFSACEADILPVFQNNFNKLCSSIYSTKIFFIRSLSCFAWDSCLLNSTYSSTNPFTVFSPNSHPITSSSNFRCANSGHSE